MNSFLANKLEYYVCVCFLGSWAADKKFGGFRVSEAGERDSSGRGKRKSEPRTAARDRWVPASDCHTQGTASEVLQHTVFSACATLQSLLTIWNFSFFTRNIYTTINNPVNFLRVL